jgi:Zn-dependent peptidase ImmA (M78 family)/DNA-binding XRE family transcriptional regulator
MIFGARITQAREFNSLTQVQLAQMVGIAQSTIANFERDREHPTEEMAAKIAEALKFPVGFFTRDVSPYFAVGSLEFRAKSAVSARKIKHAYQYGHIVFELASLLSKNLTMPPMRLPRLEGDPEKAAAKVRSELGMSPNTPIPNLADALEISGIFVFALPELFEDSLSKVDGFSVWAGDGKNLVPSIFVRANVPGDRQRLTMAHEVGELCLADMPPGRERETRANRFAGALLMPEERFRAEFHPPFTLYDFGKAKRYFGVSMQAAIVRSYQLRIITEKRYHALFQQLSSKGLRKAEPPEFDVPFEKPRALYKMVELRYGNDINFTKLGKDAGLNPWFIRKLLSTHASKADLAGAKLEAQVLEFRKLGYGLKKAGRPAYH